MKPVITASGLPIITAIYKSKISLENFLIALAIIIGITTQLLVFIMHKSAFKSVSFSFSFILWVASASPVILATIIIRLRTEVRQNLEYQKNRIEKTILQLEAKALRAQMSPHFIFNCMNSIKLLIQQKEEDKAITYLSSFSKLMRVILQNSDKKEITLFEEIETCRLYLQLESMRFNNRFHYEFDMEKTLDLKSIMVPALIIQPFIENAIWHGIMPKEGASTLTVKIIKTDRTISCIIDDDGVGRAIAMQNKFIGSNSAHQSKGVSLTQTRLELNNVLSQRHATIQIIDKANGDNESTGTKVVLVFNEE